jgi:hypothetical protein
MASLTGPRPTAELADEGRTRLIPVEASTTIHMGGMVAINAAGNAVPAAKTAGLLTLGMAEAVYAGGIIAPGLDAVNQAASAALFPQIPNLGSAGAISVRVRKGVFKYDNDSTISAANMGQLCIANDDHTVAADIVPVTQAGFTITAALLQQLANFPVVFGSLLVQNNAKTVTYVEHTDYYVDYIGGIIWYEGATLINGVTVQVGYSCRQSPKYSAAGKIVQIDADGVWVDFWQNESKN